MVRDIIRARGHKNISAKHKSTFQITIEPDITKRADCIIAVSADKGISGLSNELKKAAKKDSVGITLTIVAGTRFEVVTGKGCNKLEFTDAKDIVIRKSDFISERTLMIKADKSAADLDRELITSLKRPEDIVIIVEIVD
jgi:uncharacterized protein